MRTKKFYISISLFILFIGSCLLTSPSINSNLGSSTGTLNTKTNSVTSYKISSLNADTNLTIYNSDNPGVIIGDGHLSAIWNSPSTPKMDVPAFTSSGVQGYMQAVHDSHYVYVLFAYYSGLTWLGVEFNATSSPMENGHDGWIFGSSSSTSTFYGDIYFVGESTPVQDIQNDVSYERFNGSNQLNFIEIQRAMDTHDTAGKDVVFTDSMSLSVRFASDVLHKTQPTSLLYTLDFTTANLPVASTGGTTTTTSTTPLGVIKAERFQDWLYWGSLGFFFNIILLNLLIFYGRRSRAT